MVTFDQYVVPYLPPTDVPPANSEPSNDAAKNAAKIKFRQTSDTAQGLQGACCHGRSPKLAAFAAFAGPPDLLRASRAAAHSTRDACSLSLA